MSKFVRLSPSQRCPICGKPDWCLIAHDESAAICARVSDGAAKRCGQAGYLHRLQDSDGWRPPPRGRRAALMLRREANVDFGELAECCAVKARPDGLMRLASELGVSGDALRRLGIGFDGQAWTFPMRDAAGRVIGIHRRLPNGRKLCIKGSRNGLFIPRDLDDSGELLVCEGESDCAALLTLNCSAVGRPSCTGGVELVCRFASGRDVVVVADRDGPGQRGAEALARTLRLYCPDVRVIQPPSGVKDRRDWVKRGATTADVQAVIDAAKPVHLEITTNAAGH